MEGLLCFLIYLYSQDEDADVKIAAALAATASQPDAIVAHSPAPLSRQHSVTKIATPTPAQVTGHSAPQTATATPTAHLEDGAAASTAMDSSDRPEYGDQAQEDQGRDEHGAEYGSHAGDDDDDDDVDEEDEDGTGSASQLRILTRRSEPPHGRRISAPVVNTSGLTLDEDESETVVPRRTSEPLAAVTIDVEDDDSASDKGSRPPLKCERGIYASRL